MQLPKIKTPLRLRQKPKSAMKAGLPPGTIVHVGPKRTDKKTLELIQFDHKVIIDEQSDEASEILDMIDKKKVNWINIDGLHNVDLIKQVGEYFALNPLILEDVVNAEQRPKLEEYENGLLFFPMKALNTLTGDSIEYEQISFVLGDHFILSFQEKEGDLFDGLRARMQNPANRIRIKSSDYMFYRLIDTVVDNYYVVMEYLGEHIEAIEEEVYLHPTNRTIEKIQEVKKELIYLRKALYPTREALKNLINGDHKNIDSKNISFLNDVYDHIVQLIDLFESYRELVSNLMDMYMSTISNRMNEIMKVLTIISTIFIPLSFIAGVYGMNFEHMPELDWRYGYFVTIAVMLTIMVGMLLYFRKKKWL